MDTNPYASPSTENLEAEEKDFPWYVAARGIYVADGATLPPIDLDSGASEEELIPLKHAVIMRGKENFKATVIIICIATGALAAIKIPQAWKMAAAIAIGLAYSLYARSRRRFIRFTHFRKAAGTRSLEASAVWRVVAVTASILSFVAVGAAFLLEMPLVMIAFIVFTILSSVAGKRARRTPIRGLEMREAGGNPGWVRIGGASPVAIAKLEEIQKLRLPI